LGRIVFDDDTYLEWRQGEFDMYLFFADENDIIGYSEIPLRFKERRFSFIEDREFPPKNLEKHSFVSKFNPWGENAEHFDQYIRFIEIVGAPNRTEWDESNIPKSVTFLGKGCIITIGVLISIFLIMLLIAILFN